MLDQNIKAQLQMYMEKIDQPIELIASLDDSSVAAQMRELLEELGAMSAKISVRFDGSFRRKPSFQVTQKGKNMGVHFAALPMGHEFTSLILALLQTSGYPPKVSEEVQKTIRNLSGSMHFETWMSLTCHNCPDVVQALNLMAILNPQIEHVAIDGALFSQEVEGKQIMAVPSVYLNEENFASGRMEIEQIIAKVDTGAVQRAAEAISQEAPFDVLIVGAGPSGAAAAVYAARKGIRVGIVAERFGGQTMDTLGIENYASVLHTEGPRFSADLRAHVDEYGVKVFENQRVKELIKAADGTLMHTVVLESGARMQSKTVIVSTGARWRNVNVPGEKELKNKGVAYCPHCDGPLFKGKKVAVIGGGNSGVEAALDLAGIVEHVSVLEFNDTLKADAVLVNKLKALPNVSIYSGAQTTEITGTQKVDGLTFKNRSTDQMVHLELSGVFVQIGLVPNTEWIKGLVECSRFGEIVINERCETNIPGVFAAGDVTTVPYKQIGIAAGEGAKAALSAFDYLMRHG